MRTKQQNKNDLAKPMDPNKIAAPQDDYETNGHLRTLMDAEMIKMDPDKMKKVHALVGRHSKAIKSLQDLKDTYQEKYGPKKAQAMADDGDEDDA